MNLLKQPQQTFLDHEAIDLEYGTYTIDKRKEKQDSRKEKQEYRKENIENRKKDYRKETRIYKIDYRKKK